MKKQLGSRGAGWSPGRVAVGMAVLTLLPLAVLAVSSVKLASSGVADEVGSRMETTAAVGALYMDTHMAGLRELVESYATRPRLRDALNGSGRDEEAIEYHLSELLQARPDIHTALLATPDGRAMNVAPSTPALIGTDFSHRDWYRGVTASRSTYISEGFVSASPDSRAVVAVASPVFVNGPEGGPTAILVVAYGVDALDTFTRDFAESQDTTLTVTDRQGRLLAGGHDGDELLEPLGDDPRVREALAQRSGVMETSVDGATVLSAYNPVPGLGWTVTAEVSRAQALEPVSTLRGTVAGIALLLSAILITGLVLFWRNLQQRRKAEETIAAGAEENRRILDAANDAFISMDVNGRVTRWNPQAEATFGWSAEESIGRTVAELIIPPELREAHDRGREHYLSTGEGPVLSRRVELEALHKDGHLFPVELAVWPVEVGEVVSFNAFVHDITERRHVQSALAAARDEATQATQMKSEFLANMSHEIRTPMNGVLGMSTLLLHTDLTNEQKSYVDTIRNSADALLTIINDILDFSKIEAGRLDLEKIDFDVRAVIEETAELLWDPAAAKGLEIIAFVQPDVPRTVLGDPGRVRQILLNLAGNAVKFTGSGEVVIGCRVDRRDGDRVSLLIEVTDTGPGIPEDTQERLFQSFSQADASTTRRYGGTGLGLAISKQLAELMGGQIGVRSELGLGSTFWFTIDTQERPDRHPVAVHPRGMDGVRVLVVDDNETNRDILEQQLTYWGMRVVTAHDGNDALAALLGAADTDDPFAIVLLDYQMPDMDGLEVARRIRDDSRLASLRLAMLTSSGHRGEARSARALGIEWYLVKPLRQSALYDCLAQLTGDTVAHIPTADTEAETSEASAQVSGSRRPHVLVVEDNAVNQKVAVRTLEKLGYRADVAANGVEALEAVQAATYDAVLMDCQMPEMDGFEATRRIRSLDGAAADLPIIAMTASAMAEDETQCREAGMDDFLSKPVRWDELRRTLRHWVHASESPLPRVEVDAGEVLDREALGSLMQITGGQRKGDDFGSMVTLFVEGARRGIIDLRAAVDNADAGAAIRAAHALRGSSSTMAALEISALSQEIEDLASTGDLDGLRARLPDLDAALDRAAAALAAAEASTAQR